MKKEKGKKAKNPPFFPFFSCTGFRRKKAQLYINL